MLATQDNLAEVERATSCTVLTTSEEVSCQKMLNSSPRTSSRDAENWLTLAANDTRPVIRSWPSEDNDVEVEAVSAEERSLHSVVRSWPTEEVIDSSSVAYLHITKDSSLVQQEAKEEDENEKLDSTSKVADPVMWPVEKAIDSQSDLDLGISTDSSLFKQDAKSNFDQKIDHPTSKEASSVMGPTEEKVIDSESQSDLELRISADPSLLQEEGKSGGGKKSDPTSKDAIPMKYVAVVQQAFGETSCDLYADVLQVQPDVSLREIRMAYFRRGREVLSQDRKVSNGSSISKRAKDKFQAVSAAYEVLSNPSWKRVYDAVRFEPARTDSPVTSILRGQLTPTALRSSKSPAHMPQVQNAVRWSEEVEEVVFDQFPQESASEDSSLSGIQRRKGKKEKGKRRVIVDTEELEIHLEKLNKEAARHFVADFLDDLESSVEELLSIGSWKTDVRMVKSEGGQARKSDASRLRERHQSPDLELNQEAVSKGDSFAAVTRATIGSVSSLTVSDAGTYKCGPNRISTVAEDKASCEGQSSVSTSSTTSTESSSQQDLTLSVADRGSEVFIATRVDEGKDMPIVDGKAESCEKTPGFIVMLMSYLGSLACDLTSWENGISGLMETIMISEDDLDGMLGILRTEVEMAPVELD